MALTWPQALVIVVVFWALFVGEPLWSTTHHHHVHNHKDKE